MERPKKDEKVLTKQGLTPYQSQTLNIEDNNMIFGELYKKSNSNASRFIPGKSLYL
jgi:hypothetical protein